MTRALDAVGAGHLLDTAMRSLSGGEARRVLLARALVRRPHQQVRAHLLGRARRHAA